MSYQIIKNSPYTSRVEGIVQHFIEFGIMKHFDELGKQIFQLAISKDTVKFQSKTSKSDSEAVNPLNFESIEKIFVIYFIGISITSLMFLLELFVTFIRK